MAKKSNKEKAQAQMGIAEMPKNVTEAAKQNHALHLSVDVEEKMVDGKKTVTGSFRCYDYKNPELKEEFTDMEKLKEKVSDHLDKFEKALSK